MHRLLIAPARVLRPYLLALLLLFVPCVGVNAQAPAPQQSSEAEHQPPVSAKINHLAHELIATGLRTNALAGIDLNPWHIKIEYQILMPGEKKPVSGTVEEWHVSPYRWRRDFSGGAPGLTGSEWSLSKLERYETKNEWHSLGRRYVTLRVARPVIDPLYQAANIHPEYPLTVERVKLDPLILNCVSVVNARQYASQTNPDWLFPIMCLDTDVHLRVTNGGDTSVQFNDLRPFHNRAVARDVRVIQNGQLQAEMKVTQLEDWTPSDNTFEISKSAAVEPYKPEPGEPHPQSVYEVGAHVPLQPDGYPYQGSALASILIHKDGTVKVERDLSLAPSLPVMDAVERAVNEWKYKPYLVDGQPVEIRYTVVYPLGGKPFVPEYDRPASAAVTTGPDDYFSAYDPKRDPFSDLEKAKTAAAKTHRRILMEVGGSWCSWCAVMDKFFAEHDDVRQLRDANFVLMKVNMDPLNENVRFLSQYPRIPSYPFLFVLDDSGKVVIAKRTNDLEDGDHYDAKRFMDFLQSARHP